MSDQKTKLIAGESFTISQPYLEGHVLTAAEAKTLNQVRSENIGNNMRTQVKEALEAKEAGDSSKYDALAAAVAQYDAEYTFAMGGSGVSTRRLDPVEREARAIATDLIRADLAAKGRKITQVPEGLTKDEWEAKLDTTRETLMAREDVLKAAKKRVADKEKLIAGDASELGL
jgi:hypothetical protein